MATVYRAIWASAAVPGGISVSWRALNWKEHRQVMARYGHLELTANSPMNLYREVYASVLLSGPAPDSVSAGIMAQVARQQLLGNALSGDLEAVASKLIEKRNWLGSNYIESCRAIIAATFRIPFEEMDTWDADQIFERFVMAEYALGQQFNPVDPRQVAAEEAAAAKGVPLQQRQPRNAKEAAYMKAAARRQAADRTEAGQSGPGQTSNPMSTDTQEFSWGK